MIASARPSRSGDSDDSQCRDVLRNEDADPEDVGTGVNSKAKEQPMFVQTQEVFLWPMQRQLHQSPPFGKTAPATITGQ